MTDSLYVHYVATVNWLILTIAYTIGVVWPDQSNTAMLLTVLIALTLGNMLVYLNGLVKKLDELDFELQDQ